MKLGRSQTIVVSHEPIGWDIREYADAIGEDLVIAVFHKDPRAFRKLRKLSARGFIVLGTMLEPHSNLEEIYQEEIWLKRLPKVKKTASNKKRFYPRTEQLSDIVGRTRLREKIFKTKITFWDFVAEPGISVGSRFRKGV